MTTLWPVSVRGCAVSDIIDRLSSENRAAFGYLFYDSIDELPGLYCFWVRGRCLYVGMSTNLKRRLKQHCESEDNERLADYFNTYNGEIVVSVVYKEGTTETSLRRLELEAIKAMNPIVNVQGASR